MHIAMTVFISWSTKWRSLAAGDSSGKEIKSDMEQKVVYS